MTGKSGRRRYVAWRDCRRCKEPFGLMEEDDYRYCLPCRRILTDADTGAMRVRE